MYANFSFLYTHVRLSWKFDLDFRLTTEDISEKKIIVGCIGVTQARPNFDVEQGCKSQMSRIVLLRQ